jgi:hypothetical protein
MNSNKNFTITSCTFSRLNNKCLFVNLRLQQLRFLSDDKFAAGIKKGKKRNCINTSFTQYFYMSGFYGLIRAFYHGLRLFRAEILAQIYTSRVKA